MLQAAAAFDHDRSGVAGLRGQSAGSPADPKVKAVAAVYEWELDGAERFRPVRAENQSVVACLQSGEKPLQQIDAAGHCGQVYSFRGGAALDVDDDLDRMDDVAFLAMDLEFLGRKDLADYFLDRYAVHSADTAPSSLRDFYIAYRAVVRAKVDCVRLSQGRSEAAEDAARHLAIATQHLESGSVRLALIGGNPGTGKSTVAHALAKQVAAQVISTDDVRRELREFGVITGNPGALNAGLYSPDNVTTVYDIALRRARVLLSHGQSVILYGTWRDPQTRAHAHRIATST